MAKTAAKKTSKTVIDKKKEGVKLTKKQVTTTSKKTASTAKKAEKKATKKDIKTVSTKGKNKDTAVKKIVEKTDKKAKIATAKKENVATVSKKVTSTKTTIKKDIKAKKINTKKTEADDFCELENIDDEIIAEASTKKIEEDTKTLSAKAQKGKARQVGKDYSSFEKSLINPFYAQASQKKLLTKEQEEFHAKRYEEWKKVVQKKAKRNKNIDVEKETRKGGLGENGKSGLKLTKKEKQIAAMGKESRDELILSNLRLVISNARKFATRNLTFDDLVQHGTIGLFRAIEKFDWRKGFKFSTYATYWIWQAIGRAIADHDRIIRLPVHIREFANKYNKAVIALTEKLGSTPSEKDIAAYLGVTVFKVREIKIISQEPVSADATIGDEGNTTLLDVHQDESEVTIEEIILKKKKEEALMKIITQLRPIEKYVFIARNGLLANEAKKTFEEIASDIKRTRQRVEQMEKEINQKVKVLAYKMGLQDIFIADA